MQYFNVLPKLVKTDSAGNSIVLTNILARASILNSFLNNPAIYYNYNIQDGDTPEIIAHKYYGDVYRYWIVLFANQIIDPQWQWPLFGNTFNEYIQNKYPSTDVYNTIQQYQKIITQTDISTNTVTVNKIAISQNVYTSLSTTTNSYTFPTGDVTVTISKNALSIYDYEVQQNENNRNIKIINSAYVSELEKELQSLMRQ
jgi:Base plate wedge protein 53